VNETTPLANKPTERRLVTSLVAIGVVSTVWMAFAMWAAVYLTRNTEGENVGKFVGTIASGIAFGPPAFLFFQRYRAATVRDATARMERHAARAAEVSTAEPLGPTEGSQPD
jgi:hypothetical protein